MPTAARAVAKACGKNAVALAIPCHRIILGDGSLGGYRWGLHRKRVSIDMKASPSARSQGVTLERLITAEIEEDLLQNGFSLIPRAPRSLLRPSRCERSSKKTVYSAVISSWSVICLVKANTNTSAIRSRPAFEICAKGYTSSCYPSRPHGCIVSAAGRRFHRRTKPSWTSVPTS